MCGRYQLGRDEQPPEMQEIIREVNRRADAGEVRTGGEVFPADRAPVVASGRSRRPGVFPMTWGYAVPNGRRVINARSETAAAKPLFRDGMASRRCAVPALSYYEWARTLPGRPKYAIRPEGEAMTWMAGIYRLRGDAAEFAILTRPPVGEIGFIHSRMPVLLPAALVPAWIDPDADAGALLDRAVGRVRFDLVEADPAQLTMDFDALEV